MFHNSVAGAELQSERQATDFIKYPRVDWRRGLCTGDLQ